MQLVTSGHDNPIKCSWIYAETVIAPFKEGEEEEENHPQMLKTSYMDDARAFQEFMEFSRFSSLC